MRIPRKALFSKESNEEEYSELNYLIVEFPAIVKDILEGRCAPKERSVIPKIRSTFRRSQLDTRSLPRRHNLSALHGFVPV